MEARPPAHPFAFPHAYRLKHRRLIRSLFDRSRKDVGSVAFGCIRLLYRTVSRPEVSGEVPVQVAFAPGRQARKAVARNRIKRILREVYRVHQRRLTDLFLQRSDGLIVMVLFRGHPAEVKPCVSRDLPEALRRLAERLARAPGS